MSANGRWRHFVARNGWRAYAVPVLVVVTIAALLTMRHKHPNHAAIAGGAHETANAGDPQAGTGADDQGRAPGGQAMHPGATAVEGMSNPAAAHYRPGATRSARPLTIHLADDGPGACADNDYSQLVVVSIRQQHLWACARHRQVNSTPVTTGMTKDDDRTPLGSWRVQAKQRDRYLTGPGYRDYVQYWVPFNGDFGFHDASWQTIPFGSPQYRTKGSHGCVHLPTTLMAWLYHWATVYDTVVTIEK